MAFYAPLFPDGRSVEDLGDIMRKGGETLQEVVSTMLVQDGVMIRREHDLSNVIFETVRDEERFDRNRQYMDALAPVLAEMAYMSGDIDRRVNRMNERIEREAAVRAVARAGQPPDPEAVEQVEIGRASCRERWGRCVLVPGVGV